MSKEAQEKPEELYTIDTNAYQKLRYYVFDGSQVGVWQGKLPGTAIWDRRD